MKKNQVNSILINQTKRRNTVFAYVCLIVIVFALLIADFILYSLSDEEKYVTYNEKSDIDYQVFYKQNDFFDESYLESNKQYIATLIEKIDTNFNYEISIDDVDVEYKYTYRIEANVIVRDEDNKNLFYDKTEILLEEVEKVTSLKKVSINEQMSIDYSKYNDKINNLIRTYQLKNAESFLNINMYINIVGSCEEFVDNQEEIKVVTLSIPLAEDTISIDFVDNMGNSTNNVMKCNSESKNSFMFLLLGVGLMVVEVVLIISVIRYEIKTRTAETIYEKELKKILNNYGSSIQMLGSDFEFKNYQLLKITDFSDILEISDKLRQPILMKENPEKNGAYFVIPSNTHILYVYRLKVSDIEKEINKSI